MTTHRLINWILAIAIALTLAAAFHLDEPTQETVRTPDQIAQDHCGPGAAIEWRKDGTLTCRLHNGRGKPLVIAEVRP